MHAAITVKEVCSTWVSTAETFGAAVRRRERTGIVQLDADTGSNPVAAPHVRPGRVSHTDPGRRFAAVMAFTDCKCFADAVSDIDETDGFVDPEHPIAIRANDWVGIVQAAVADII